MNPVSIGGWHLMVCLFRLLHRSGPCCDDITSRMGLPLPPVLRIRMSMLRSFPSVGNKVCFTANQEPLLIGQLKWCHLLPPHSIPFFAALVLIACFTFSANFFYFHIGTPNLFIHLPEKCRASCQPFSSCTWSRTRRWSFSKVFDLLWSFQRVNVYLP